VAILWISISVIKVFFRQNFFQYRQLFMCHLRMKFFALDETENFFFCKFVLKHFLCTSNLLKVKMSTSKFQTQKCWHNLIYVGYT
jgi:hypothetical protein